MKLPKLNLPYVTLCKKDLKKDLESQSEGTAEKVATPQDMAKGMLNVKDIIAPSAVEVDFSHIRIGPNYYTTLFVSGYPRFVGANWLSPIINFDHTLDLSMFYYPVKSK